MHSEVANALIYEGMPPMLEKLKLYEGPDFSLNGILPVTINRRSLRVIESDALLVRSDVPPQTAANEVSDFATDQAGGSVASGGRGPDGERPA